jgi:hypothetical protein
LEYFFEVFIGVENGIIYDQVRVDELKDNILVNERTLISAFELVIFFICKPIGYPCIADIQNGNSNTLYDAKKQFNDRIVLGIILNKKLDANECKD